MRFNDRGDGMKRRLAQIFNRGLTAVAPDAALLRHVRREADTLLAGGRVWPLPRQGRVLVAGAGKGVAPMAQALEGLLADCLDAGQVGGLVITKYGHELPLRSIRLLQAAHPVPDAAGQAATARMLDMLASATERDMVICLLTGGASALTPAPVPGLTLAHLQALTERLLACGATIEGINALRKHLSRFGGGQLARVAAPAPVLTIMISDVIGDDPAVIGSGPTAPDCSTFAQCLDIVARYRLEDQLPPPVLHHLREGAAGRIADTPKPGDPLFGKVVNVLAASNRQALEAAADEARAQGMAVTIDPQPMRGEARQAAVALVRQARQAAAASGRRPFCLLAGGETTVSLHGTGRGGRNQEMALAASLELEGHSRVVALFAGTDGTDGPTDAAGGFAHAGTVPALGGRERALALLENNDSHAALQRSGDLFCTGPTRTNVMDMALVCVL